MTYLKQCSQLILIFCLLTFPQLTKSAELLAIVSARNTADVLSGAHLFLKEFKDHRITLRTTDQFNGLSERERQSLIEKSDLVFAGGIFGESASLLLKYLNSNSSSPIKSFIAVHSDRSLVMSSRVDFIPMLDGADLDVLMEEPPVRADLNISQWSFSHLEKYDKYKVWLLSKIFWADRETENIDGLFRHLVSLTGTNIDVPEPILQQPLKVYIDDKSVPIESLKLSSRYKWVAILDYETGGRPGEIDLIKKLCAQIEKQQNIKCMTVLAKWGTASVSASKVLAQYKNQISAVISLQNFVIGGGGGRAEVNQYLVDLNVPVLKGIRLSDSTADEYQLSEEGLHWDSVHYRVAMPELQGISQPLVLAAMTEASIDLKTGVKLAVSKPIESQVSLMARRIVRWIALQEKNDIDKKIAIIYYNHPPGRHNIGADNLNVPSSLLQILRHLKSRGYDTGELPQNRDELLDILQERGVNLPENRGELAAMAEKVETVTADQYQIWFDRLPKFIQDEMQNGPLGYLHVMLQTAVQLDNPEIAQRLIRRVVEDLKHAMEGADHKSRDRVIDLLSQLENVYQDQQNSDWNKAQELVDAIVASGVEGIRGWGKAPGQVMVHDNELLIPGVQFGNVFVGPQPPRGWELNEEILHANLSFPPTHQYLAFYHWLRNSFKADALVHLGRHSTYEFLPRHRVGMGEVDYPTSLIDDLPSVYPYIVDGVGEGIQAKRRGLAVMVDHLTPPLESTELYDKLLELRQLVESYEAAPESAGAMRERAIVAIKDLVEQLSLTEELTNSMQGELEVRGVESFDQIDNELLVHEVGHYLTKLQEDFMPLGLHSFGQDWSQQAIDTMLRSMAYGEDKGIDHIRDQWSEKLSESPKAELVALDNGLDGGYIKAGRGNDPIRTPEVLPTGRNFFALDGSLIPSRLGYQVGVDLATQARSSTNAEQADAIVLWASDVVRDEGAMIAFGFDMLGVKPVWSSRGIVKKLERLDIESKSENGEPRIRRDTLYTTSGLFRDLYGAHIIWLEKAVLMALDASSDTIRRDYPALSLALNSALSVLGKEQNPGQESLKINHVAKQWVEDTRASLQQGLSSEEAGRIATYRLFGDAPGTYGAGVNRLVERSGSWEQRSEIADVYIRRMSHAYGANVQGQSQPTLFTQRLETVANTYLGRSSNLYGLLDNNDAFDYLGGLSLAVETVTGEVPNNYILAHEDNNNIAIEPLSTALLSELRGRFLNPQWLKPLMEEGYAGARTMGSEFLEYLWGWQVTNPETVKSWVWDEVKSVYIDDRYNIDIDTFLEENHNVYVKTNMLAVMLVAAQKGFWQTDQASLEQISQQFAELIIEHGLPGSGHTSPDNRIFEFIDEYISDALRVAVKAVLDDSQIESQSVTSPSTISELSEQSLEKDQQQRSDSTTEQNTEHSVFDLDYRWFFFILTLLIIIGIVRGARVPIKQK